MAAATEIQVQPIEKGAADVAILGTSPLICNRMAEKARRELLLPHGRKTDADKRSTLKHDPLEEFRASPYTIRNPEVPALLAMLSSAFKGAMATAALDMPGAKKAQIGRLVYVEREYVPIFGEPQLLLSVVRSADMNRTPDIRSRAILPEWACVLSISFVKSLLTLQTLVNLINAGGTTAGIGDWRPEKGKGNYGQFRVVNTDDPAFLRILEQGRAVQEQAMADPEAYDDETTELLGWFGQEVKRRGRS